MINNSMPNFLSNHLALIKIKTNAIVDFDLDNFSFNKKSYFFNNCNFLSNNNYYKDNLNNGSNSKFNINLTVLIKNYIW